jgi:hypothetical protein
MVQVGESELRKEYVDGMVKGFAEAQYKFKQAVTISSTNAWLNTFYQETPTVLTAATGNAVKGIPRGAAFPQASVEWTKQESWVNKYGAEDNIFWEDILTDDVDVQARTIFRITEMVVKAVDDEIWSVLANGGSFATLINGFRIDQDKYWNGLSGAVIDNLMYAKQLIAEDNYDTSDLMAFISPRDHRSIVSWLSGKGAQFPSVGEDMARNGRVGSLAGIRLVVSNSVTTSQALVVKPKICATWKEAVPLQSELVTDPYKSVKVRVVELGTTQLTDPSAVCLITGTQTM